MVFQKTDFNEELRSFTYCHSCQYYEPQGRRGGICQQLGVSVEGHWLGCPLMTIPFSKPSPHHFSHQANLKTSKLTNAA